MLCCVDPPEQSKGHAVMSLDLQAALGTIEWGAEERLEILRDKKQQLEMGEVETKLLLVGHMELDEGGGPQKKETEAGECDDGTGRRDPTQAEGHSINNITEGCEKKGKYYKTGTKMDGVNERDVRVQLQVQVWVH